MKVKVKKLHPEAQIPKYAKKGDAGLDVVATRVIRNEYNFIEYGTGIAVEIPTGYVGLLFPRSSISNTSFTLCNSVGVVDSGYRGEITFRFRNTGTFAKAYKPGDKIGQLVILPYPSIELEESEELSSTERGSGGYGSTGA